MPNFIDHGGEYTFAPPYMGYDTQFYGFILDADVNALQAMCDKYLNNPLKGKRRFVPAGPFVMLVTCQLGKLVSMTPPYSNMGWFIEKELAVWVMVIDETAKRAFWFQPYMWVDNAYAMANGREVFGFPKQMATFNFPASPDTADLFTMDTLVLKKFSPDTQAETIRLFEITRTDQKQHEFTPGAIWSDIETVAKEMLYMLDDGLSLLGNAKTILTSLDDIVHARIPMVFIKEFRSATNTNGACFQSIIESVPLATKVHGGGLLPYVYNINIELCDSHPVRTECGLPASGPIQSKMGVWINFDFQLPIGTETIIS